MGGAPADRAGLDGGLPAAGFDADATDDFAAPGFVVDPAASFSAGATGGFAAVLAGGLAADATVRFPFGGAVVALEC